MTDAPAASAAPATPPAPVTPAPTPALPAWTEPFDTDTRAWLDVKGHARLDDKAALAAVVKAARAAESLIGTPADRTVVLPTNLTDAAAMQKVYDRLGRPKEATGYELKAPGGEPSELAGLLAPEFHAAGLTKAQGEHVFARLNAAIEAKMTKQATEAKIVSDQAMEKLKGEWGATHAHNVSVAEQAMRALGIEDAERANLLADATQLRRFQQIGAKIVEPNFVLPPGDPRSAITGLPSTPEGARKAIRELSNDKEFSAKFSAGDIEAKRHVENLAKIASMGNR